MSEIDVLTQLPEPALPPALDARVGERALRAFERAARARAGEPPCRRPLLVPLALSAPVIAYLAWAIQFSAALLR
jgi:hypothetical protein